MSSIVATIISVVAENVLSAEWRCVRTSLDDLSVILKRIPDCTPPGIAQCLLVSGEDHRHARHPGFDLIAIGRAIWRRTSCGTREGASTIEQQIVRVLTGQYDRTLARKLREIALAVLVARRYSKQRLPALYLWIGYYGWRMNGYLQACGRLGLSPQSLTLEEAARLVARLKYPQPRRPPEGRIAQIERRAKHLCALHKRHIRGGIYEHLDVAPLRDSSTLLKPLPQP